MSDALVAKPVRVGIAGLGRSGWVIHAAAIEQLPEQFRVVAVADPLEQRLAEAASRFGARGFADPLELVSDPEVDLVVVATPSHTHVAVGLAALEAGKHVLIEKPMAASVAEVDQLAAAAERSQRIVTAYQNLRLEASLTTIAELLASGRIGEPALVRRCAHTFGRRADWQTLRELGGGELPNTTLHFLDQLLTLIPLEVPITTFADLRQLVSAGDAEDHVQLTLRPATGPLLEIETSRAVALPQPAWFVVGSAGTITGSTSELQVKWHDPAVLPELTADAGAAEDRKYPAPEEIDWQTEDITIEPVHTHTAYYRRLADTLLDGAELLVTPASIRRQLGIVDEARKQNAD